MFNFTNLFEKKDVCLNDIFKDEYLISTTDIDGHITYANKAFLDIIGYQEEEVIGLTHSFLLPNDMILVFLQIYGKH